MATTDSKLQDDLQAALECVKKGGIILYPTDTVWGIGCDATNSEAVKKIYQLKKRADSKAMLVLVDNEAALQKVVPEVPDVAWQLLEAAVNPITVIYDNACNLAPELIAPDGSVGVRLTKERFSKELCRRLRRPLVSTSANVSGKAAPAVFPEISDEIKNGVDYIVTYRQDDLSPKAPSNIIKLSKEGVVKIIR